MSGPAEEAPLSELCTICHINIPKYRCPRCFTRTCSLICSQRHKKWSQCSGVRDPAAYLRRSELATPAAFDRDFNFITGIERNMERAEREAESRGISLDHDYICSLDGKGGSRKRKRPPEMVKGEAGFLRGAEAAGVKLIRAPRGMTRNKQNCSRLHQKHKCLSWTVEWIAPSGQRTLRNCLETCSFAEAYDRIYPVPKEKRENNKARQDSEETNHDSVSEQQLATELSLTAGAGQNEVETDDPSREGQGTDAAAKPKIGESKDQDRQAEDTTQPQPGERPASSTPAVEISSHRNLYFYLHRPRTATRKTVLIPVSPNARFNTVLRNRTIVEFPTVYVLESSPQELSSKREESEFLLEEQYLQQVGKEEAGEEEQEQEEEDTGEEEASGTSSTSSDDDSSDDTLEGDDDEEEEEGKNNRHTNGAAAAAATKNLDTIDEKKVLEVLKQDIFQADIVTSASTTATSNTE